MHQHRPADRGAREIKGRAGSGAAPRHVDTCAGRRSQARFHHRPAAAASILIAAARWTASRSNGGDDALRSRLTRTGAPGRVDSPADVTMRCAPASSMTAHGVWRTSERGQLAGRRRSIGRDVGCRRTCGCRGRDRCGTPAVQGCEAGAAHPLCLGLIGQAPICRNDAGGADDSTSRRARSRETAGMSDHAAGEAVTAPCPPRTAGVAMLSARAIGRMVELGFGHSILRRQLRKAGPI